MNPCSFEVNNKGGPRDEGYVLLVLLLFLAVLSLSFLTLAERIDSQFKRDREEELIHRGVQYSRAVRNFVNEFHRYPNSIEELESTNNLHFLRKRYKDPITGKDFKILHLTDMPNFISMQGPGVSVTGLASQQQGFPALNGTTPTATGTSASGTANAESSSQSDQNSSNAPALITSSSDSSEPRPADVVKAAGAIVVGVASASEGKAIREFNRKDHYNQWLFTYDPSTDNGGILTTPSRPPLHVAIQRNQQESPLGSDSNSGQTNAPTATSLIEH
jgi:type II secretory pathway pseudopilin PulG